MANLIAIHSVGNVDTWLAADNRAQLFKDLCRGYRLFRMPEQNRVAICFEDVDAGKLETMLATPEAAAAKAADTVVDPIEIFLELEGSR